MSGSGSISETNSNGSESEEPKRLHLDEDKTLEREKARKFNLVMHNYHDLSDKVPPTGYANLARAERDVTFASKLLTMLDKAEEEGFADVISWQPHGRCFMVRDPKKIEQVLLKHMEISKWTSFQRQLYIYQFKRISRGPDRGSFYHEKFLRGRSFLAAQMTRSKIKGVRGRQRANPDQEPRFWDDYPWVQPLKETPVTPNVPSTSLQSSQTLNPPAPKRVSLPFETSQDSFNKLNPVKPASSTMSKPRYPVQALIQRRRLELREECHQLEETITSAKRRLEQSLLHAQAVEGMIHPQADEEIFPLQQQLPGGACLPPATLPYPQHTNSTMALDYPPVSFPQARTLNRNQVLLESSSLEQQQRRLRMVDAYTNFPAPSPVLQCVAGSRGSEMVFPPPTCTSSVLAPNMPFLPQAPPPPMPRPPQPSATKSQQQAVVVLPGGRVVAPFAAKAPQPVMVHPQVNLANNSRANKEKQVAESLLMLGDR